jgi:hypothetical protein
VGEVIAAHAVIVFEMSDDGLDGGATFELASDLLIDPSFLAGGADPKLMFRRGAVTAIAGIGEDAIEHVAEEFLHGRNDVRQRMPVVRVARRRDMGDELAVGAITANRSPAPVSPAHDRD